MIKIGIAARPYPGETVSGDACFVGEYEDRTLIGVVDGLGHGQGAALVAQKAIHHLEEHYRDGLVEIIQGCHETLRGTRGVVMGLALVDPQRSILTYAGVGNICIRVVGAKSVSLISANGIVGDVLPKIREEKVTYSPGDLVIIHSDGVSARFNLDDYPGLVQKEPQQIADTIARDFAREYDDAIIVVGR